MQILTPHHTNALKSAKIETTHCFRDNCLIVEFTVSHLDNLNVCNSFSKDHYNNHGLWNFDVVEVFVQRASYHKQHVKYLELQISPLQQAFALFIDMPRIKTRDIRLFCELSSRLFSEQTTAGFNAKFEVALHDIPGEGDKLFGNFFACLGSKGNREYFALNINDEAVVDFHRPDLFIELADTKGEELIL